MSDTDRLAALLREVNGSSINVGTWDELWAARLITAGVGFRDEIDVERLARALQAKASFAFRSGCDYGNGRPIEWRFLHDTEKEMVRADAAAIAREYAKETSDD